MFALTCLFTHEFNRLAYALGVFFYAAADVLRVHLSVCSWNAGSSRQQDAPGFFLDWAGIFVLVLAHPGRLLRRTHVLHPQASAFGAAPSGAFADNGRLPGAGSTEIGRASCGERVCPYVWISVGAV